MWMPISTATPSTRTSTARRTPDTATLSDLNILLNRNGGNNTSRYNWKLNADNRANDWFFESIADASAVAGERGDTFIASSKAAGAQAMLTIPMIGWVAKLGAEPQQARAASPSPSTARRPADDSQ